MPEDPRGTTETKHLYERKGGMGGYHSIVNTKTGESIPYTEAEWNKRKDVTYAAAVEPKSRYSLVGADPLTGGTPSGIKDEATGSVSPYSPELWKMLTGAVYTPTPKAASTPAIETKIPASTSSPGTSYQAMPLPAPSAPMGPETPASFNEQPPPSATLVHPGILSAAAARLQIPEDTFLKLVGAYAPEYLNDPNQMLLELGITDAGAVTSEQYQGAISNLAGLIIGKAPQPTEVNTGGEGVVTTEGGGDIYGGVYSGGDASGGGGLAGGYPPSGYYDLMRAMQAPETFGGSGFYDFLKAQLAPGGPGTAGQYYDAIQSLMSPLGNLGGDFWGFLQKMANPAATMPSTYFTALGKSVLPSELTAPGEMYSMLGDTMPQYYAAGAESLGGPPDIFGGMTAQAQQSAPYLASLSQGQPDMAMQMVQALIEMQQQSGLPFLQFLLGPSAMGGGGGGGGNAAADEGTVEYV